MGLPIANSLGMVLSLSIAVTILIITGAIAMFYVVGKSKPSRLAGQAQDLKCGDFVVTDVNHDCVREVYTIEAKRASGEFATGSGDTFQKAFAELQISVSDFHEAFDLEE